MTAFPTSTVLGYPRIGRHREPGILAEQPVQLAARKLESLNDGRDLEQLLKGFKLGFGTVAQLHWIDFRWVDFRWIDCRQRSAWSSTCTFRIVPFRKSPSCWAGPSLPSR